MENAKNGRVFHGFYLFLKKRLLHSYGINLMMSTFCCCAYITKGDRNKEIHKCDLKAGERYWINMTTISNENCLLSASFDLLCRQQKKTQFRNSFEIHWNNTREQNMMRTDIRWCCSKCSYISRRKRLRMEKIFAMKAFLVERKGSIIT